MTSATAVFEEASSSGALSRDRSSRRLNLTPFLALSAWCGLLSGLLEVGATILRKQAFDLNHLYWISRHFVWLIPLLNLALFLVFGLVLSILTWCFPRHGGWLARRLLAR